MNGIPCITDQEFSERFSWRLSGGRFPLSSQWEITCRCNLRCVMCYTDCFNTPDMLRQELSLREIVRIMDEIREAGCLELTLTGGEPLIRRDLPDLVRMLAAVPGVESSPASRRRSNTACGARPLMSHI